MLGKSLILLVAVTGMAASRASADEVHTPKPGTAERKAILDAVRDPLEDILRGEIVFRVSHLKVKDGWAFFKGQVRTKDDKPFDYQGTRYEDQAKLMDEYLVVILRHKRGRWYVVDRGLFASDVWWHGIHKELGAPLGIFDYAEGD